MCIFIISKVIFFCYLFLLFLYFFICSTWNIVDNFVFIFILLFFLLRLMFHVKHCLYLFYCYFSNFTYFFMCKIFPGKYFDDIIFNLFNKFWMFSYYVSRETLLITSFLFLYYYFFTLIDVPRETLLITSFLFLYYYSFYFDWCFTWNIVYIFFCYFNNFTYFFMCKIFPKKFFDDIIFNSFNKL